MGFLTELICKADLLLDLLLQWEFWLNTNIPTKTIVYTGALTGHDQEDNFMLLREII